MPRLPGNIPKPPTARARATNNQRQCKTAALPVMRAGLLSNQLLGRAASAGALADRSGEGFAEIFGGAALS